MNAATSIGSERGRRRKRSTWRGYAVAALLVAATTGIALASRAFFPVPDVEMLYVVVVMIAAIRCGRGPAILAALLGVAAYDFFFVPPFHTLAVADGRYVWTFVLMSLVGIVISNLTFRVQKEEEQARNAAMRAHDEEMRSSLLSATSHDLRTPLAAITGAATTLRDESEGLGAEEKSALLETICDEADRLERLVANLLEMTRLDSGGLTVKRAWVPLEEIIDSALTRLDTKLGQREIRSSLPPDLPLASVDPVLFEQVLVNLLENAAKYTPEGSPIEIAASVDPGSMTIDVRDHGPGLAPGTEEKVFEKFYRASHGGGGGVGLGLAICRGIVRAHGGDVSAMSRSDGGATFRIRMPLVAGAPRIASAGSFADKEPSRG